MLTLVEAIPASPLLSHAPGQADARASDRVESTSAPAPERVAALPRPKVAPLAPGRFEVRFTMGQRMQDKLRCAGLARSSDTPREYREGISWRYWSAGSTP